MTAHKTTVEVLDNAANGGVAAPSLAEQFKADATRIEYEPDVIGRRIGAKKLTFRDMHHLTRLLGADASNSALLQQAMMAGSVVSIDGDQIPFPKTPLQLEALMERLDFHGVLAASTAMGRFTPIPTDTDAEDAALKN
jgi:hypothetical protein